MLTKISSGYLWLSMPEECLIIKAMLSKMAEPYKKADYRNKKTI